MAEELEIFRCLGQLHGSRGTSTEAPFASPSIPIIKHDVYSSNPENLPSQCDGMEETLKKYYYWTRLKHRGTAASGIDRTTPDGSWKARDGARAIMLNDGGAIRFIPWNVRDEIRAMEGEGFNTIGFWKKFEYKKGGSPGQSAKWAMIEYTLHPPESGRENQYAIYYVYKTKQDGRQRNGIGRVYLQQPTIHYVGESSLLSASAAVVAGGSSPAVVGSYQFEMEQYSPRRVNEQQPTIHYVGESSLLSASAAAAGGSSPAVVGSYQFEMEQYSPQRVNEQQPTNHSVGGSSISASAIPAGGSSLFELFEIPKEFQFETPEKLDEFINAPLGKENI